MCMEGKALIAARKSFSTQLRLSSQPLEAQKRDPRAQRLRRVRSSLELRRRLEGE